MHRRWHRGLRERVERARLASQRLSRRDLTVAILVVLCAGIAAAAVLRPLPRPATELLGATPQYPGAVRPAVVPDARPAPGPTPSAIPSPGTALVADPVTSPNAGGSATGATPSTSAPTHPSGPSRRSGRTPSPSPSSSASTTPIPSPSASPSPSPSPSNNEAMTALLTVTNNTPVTQTLTITSSAGAPQTVVLSSGQTTGPFSVPASPTGSTVGFSVQDEYACGSTTRPTPILYAGFSYQAAVSQGLDPCPAPDTESTPRVGQPLI